MNPLHVSIARDVYRELHVQAAGVTLHTLKPRLPNHNTHLRHAIPPFLTCEVHWAHLESAWLCSWLVLTGSRNALNVIDCELHPTESSLIYSGGLVMYPSERSVQFSQQDVLWWSSKESVYFPLFHTASSHISMLCHCTHVFMYRMCILMWDAQLLLFMYCKVYILYWMQTHIWSIKLSMTNRVYLWCSSVWDCQVVMLETVINSMENVFQLNKRIKLLTF